MTSSEETASPLLTNIFLRLVRLYTSNTPIAKGKYRLYLTALDFIKRRPTALLTTVKDGRRFLLNLRTGMQEIVFFTGEYDPMLSELAGKIITEGDICIDAGANFGWYTTLMSARAGATGAAHAFEPVPVTFADLKRNRELAAHPDNIFVNNLALGDREDTVRINLFEGQGSGMASLSPESERSVSYSTDCRMAVLDNYLEENGVGDVNFVKADIEGSEMMMLKGAERLFKQPVPPVILMEMGLLQTKKFGYLPNDLLDFMRSRAEYDFYKVDELTFKLDPIDRFAPDDIGANVFCIPHSASERVKAIVNGYIRK